MNDKETIKKLLDAMKVSEDIGCTRYLDCCDDGGAFWYDALLAGKIALAETSVQDTQDD